MSVATTAMTIRGVATDLPRPIFGSAAAASRRAVNWLFHHVQAISILSMHQFVRLLLQGLGCGVLRRFVASKPPTAGSSSLRDARALTRLVVLLAQRLTPY